MSDPVLIAIIAAVQAITVALVGVVAVRLGGVRRDAAAARVQLTNDHQTNFREETDSRHEETLQLFGEVRKDIGGIRGDIRELGGRVTTLEQLELTEPPRRKRRP